MKITPELRFLRRTLSIALLIYFGLVKSVAQSYDWAFHVGGASVDRTNYLARDTASNVYVAGVFTYTVDVDPGPGVVTLSTPGSSQNALVAKYDSSGNYQWAFKLGGVGYSTASAIALDDSANVYVTGYFSGTSDFDPGPGTATLTSANSSGDFFLAKYDANGNYKWAFRLGPNPSTCDGRGLIVDHNGNVYVTGSFSYTIDFDPGPATTNLASSPSVYADGFVASYTSNGNFRWAFRLGSSWNDWAYTVNIDSFANIYITGKFRYTVDFNPGAGVANRTANGTADAFVASYDSTGAFRWVISMGGADGDEGLYVSTYGDDYVYVTGLFRDSADFDPGPGVARLYSSSVTDMDIFVARYSITNGSYHWAFRAGAASNAYELGWCIQPDDDGNIFVAGYYEGLVDFDPGPGQFNLPSTGTSSGFLAKYDSTGYLLNAFSIGSTGNAQQATTVVPRGTREINAGGVFSGSTDFDPGPGTALLNTNGAGDMFVARYIQCQSPDIPVLQVTNDSICAGSSTTLSVNSGSLNDASQWQWYAGDCGSVSAGTGSSITVSPSVTTTYFCRGEGGCGGRNRCASVTVHVYPAVSVSATASSPEICLGEPDTLQAAGAANYLWNFGSGNPTEVVTPSVTTTYSITGTDTNGCADTASVTVSVNPLPLISVVYSPAICASESDTLSASGTSSYQWSSGGVSAIEIVTPSQSTIYTVIGTDTNGCRDTASVFVTVNALPTVSCSASSGSICTGQSDTLNASGAAMYVWSSGGVSAVEIVSPLQSTTYTVTGTDTNNCTAVASIFIMVDTLPFVVLDLSAVDTQCVSASSVLLNGGQPAGGVYSGFAVAGGSFSPSSAGNGTYEVIYTITNGNGCSASASDSIFVDICSGTGIDAQSSITIFPNPAQDHLNIFIPHAYGACEIELTDQLGRLVVHGIATASCVNAFSVSGLADGVYNLTITAQSGRYVHSVIIARQ